jgi:hypothetical protein
MPTLIRPRAIRSVSTSAQPAALLKQWIPKNNRATYAAGGTIALFGLLLLKPDGSKYPDDPQDIEALHKVPFSKLFSGWM